MREEYRRFEGVLEYLWETWLHPYKERFVPAWIDTCMHLGSNSSQRYSHLALLFQLCSLLYYFNSVHYCTILIMYFFKYRAESAHARLKLYLGDTMSSLQTSFEKIHKMLRIQFGNIK